MFSVVCDISAEFIHYIFNTQLLFLIRVKDSVKQQFESFFLEFGFVQIKQSIMHFVIKIYLRYFSDKHTL